MMLELGKQVRRLLGVRWTPGPTYRSLSAVLLGFVRAFALDVMSALPGTWHC